MICFDDLPSDPLLLKQKLVEIAAMVEALSSEKIALAGERDAALAQREATLQENEKLLLLLSQFKRMLFGGGQKKSTRINYTFCFRKPKAVSPQRTRTKRLDKLTAMTTRRVREAVASFC